MEVNLSPFLLECIHESFKHLLSQSFSAAQSFSSFLRVEKVMFSFRFNKKVFSRRVALPDPLHGGAVAGGEPAAARGPARPQGVPADALQVRHLLFSVPTWLLSRLSCFFLRSDRSSLLISTGTPLRPARPRTTSPPSRGSAPRAGPTGASSSPSRASTRTSSSRSGGYGTFGLG